MTADKLTAKEIYINLISMTNCKPFSQMYFDNLFQSNFSACWDQIYILPRKVTVYSCMRYFQYKIINNILFLRENLNRLEHEDNSIRCQLPCKYFLISY